MNTDPTFSMILAALRTLAAMVGGFAIAKGWISADEATQIGGALLVLVTAGFALYSQYRNKQHVAAALEAPAPTATTAASSQG